MKKIDKPATRIVATRIANRLTVFAPIRISPQRRLHIRCQLWPRCHASLNSTPLELTVRSPKHQPDVMTRPVPRRFRTTHRLGAGHALKTIFRAWCQWLPGQFVDYRLTGHRLPRLLTVLAAAPTWTLPKRSAHDACAKLDADELGIVSLLLKQDLCVRAYQDPFALQRWSTSDPSTVRYMCLLR